MLKWRSQTPLSKGMEKHSRGKLCSSLHLISFPSQVFLYPLSAFVLMMSVIEYTAPSLGSHITEGSFKALLNWPPSSLLRCIFKQESAVAECHSVRLNNCLWMFGRVIASPGGKWTVRIVTHRLQIYLVLNTLVAATTYNLCITCDPRTGTTGCTVFLSYPWSRLKALAELISLTFPVVYLYLTQRNSFRFLLR